MPQARNPAGTVTFLFSDIEGSTKLWEAHPEVMRFSLARHDALMRGAIQSNGGFVFKTVGDAFCAAFATAPEALEAALAAQLALIEEPWPSETPIRVRIALHTGAAESRDDDYFGPPVNRVARLLSIGHGGQTLLSKATHELVRDSVQHPSAFSDLGTHQLKDLARPEEAFQLLHPLLPASFPALRSLSSQPNNLPYQLTSFVGRESEIENVKSLLGKSRLVSLIGSGGSGKTRLGIQIGADLLEDFSDGVWLVELAALRDVETLIRTVADVLHVSENRSGDLSKTVADHIQHRSMMLILDNCEHLIDGCARLADLLLKSCPNLKIVVTSREGLRIAGEVIFRVPPLALPTPNAHQSSSVLTQYAAVRLFIDRALQVDPSFAVTNETAPEVASICCQLDGIPLAIELAAARVRSLSVEQIGTRLGKRFNLLTGGSRAGVPRQQTLRALIDWSYDLLEEGEKSVLQRLSVFSGGWNLEAAEAICGDEETEAWEISEFVLSLAEKSLVVTQELAGGKRYTLLESIREYAKERLAESGQQATYKDRHLRYFTDLAQIAMPGLRGVHQKEWLSRLDQDHDNFRAALRYGVATSDGLAISGYLWWYWHFRGHITEGRTWLMSALAANPDAEPELRARSLNGAGVLAESQGDYQVALELSTECTNISRSLEDRWTCAMSLNNTGNVHGTLGDFDTAELYWRQAYEIWRQMERDGTLEDVGGLAASMDNLGNVAFAKGKLTEARDHYQQGFDVRKQAGNLALAAYSLINLGALEQKAGNLSTSLAHYHQGLQMSSEIGDNFGISYFLFGIAELADPRTAAKILGRCERIREELGLRLSPSESTDLESVIARIRTQLTETEFDALLADGRSMSIDEAVRLAQDVRISEA